MYADELAKVFITCLEMIRERAKTSQAEADVMLECYHYLIGGAMRAQLRRVNVNEAAEMAGKSASQIRRMIRQGKLTGYQSENSGRLELIAAEVPLSQEQRLQVIAKLKEYAKKMPT
jgi:hypothetical protein